MFRPHGQAVGKVLVFLSVLACAKSPASPEDDGGNGNGGGPPAVQWREHWGFTLGDNRDDRFYAVCAHPGGWVTVGFSVSFSNNALANAVAYLWDGSGNAVWGYQYGGDQWDEFRACAVSPSGEVAVAGQTSEFDAEGDMWVMKLDSQGNPIWGQTLGEGGYGDRVTGIAFLPDGDVVITGETNSFGQGPNGGLLVARLSGSDGSILWQRVYGDPLLAESGADVAVLADGNVVVGGFQSTSTRNAWVLKVSAAAGDTLWTRVIGGASDDEIDEIAVDGEGNIVFVGMSLSYAVTPGNGDLWVVKLGPSGNEIWNVSIDSPGSAHDYATGLAIGERYYVVGGMTWGGPYGRDDVWVVAVDPGSGGKIGEVLAGTASEDRLQGVAAGPAGSMVFVGWMRPDPTQEPMMWIQAYRE